MNASEVLRVARDNGIRVGVSGTDLIVEADREPTPAVLEALKCHKAGIVALLAADHDSWSAEDWQAYFEERAGIAEFDGRQSREQAEAEAFKCCIVEWLGRNPGLTDPDRCAWCGRPDRREHTVVPFGTGDHGHAWLHPECWDDWHQDRRERAQRFFAGMGVLVSSTMSKRADSPKDFMTIGGDQNAEAIEEQQVKWKG